MKTLTIIAGSPGLENIEKIGTVFSPRRCELVEALKDTGAQSIYALAKRLERHYGNVFQDVAMLSACNVIEKDESGNVFVPWGKIVVEWQLKSGRQLK